MCCETLPGTARSCQLITRDGRLVRADVEVVEVSPPNGANTHAPYANTHAPYASGGRGAEGLFALFLVVVQTPCRAIIGGNQRRKGKPNRVADERRNGTERCGVARLWVFIELLLGPLGMPGRATRLGRAVR